MIEYIDKTADELINEGYNIVTPINENYNLKSDHIISFYDKDLLMDIVYIGSKAKGKGFILSKFSINREIKFIIEDLVSIKLLDISIYKNPFHSGILDLCLITTNEDLVWDRCVTESDKIEYSNRVLKSCKIIDGFTVDKGELLFNILDSLDFLTNYNEVYMESSIDLTYSIKGIKYFHSFSALYSEYDDRKRMTIMIEHDKSAIIRSLDVLKLLPLMDLSHVNIK